jgi:hypothetical protein
MIPIYIANPSPFRLMLRDSDDQLNATIEEINQSTYNYVKLHRASKFFHANIQSSSPVGIGYDGSFLLLATKEYSTIDATLDEFNKVFASILIGGVYIEAIGPPDLSHGELSEYGYFRHTNTFGANADFHKSLGEADAGSSESLKLLDSDTVLASDIIDAYMKGEAVLRKVPNISPSLFLSGFSYFKGYQLRESLSHSWISIEQILDFIWDQVVLKESKEVNIEKRSKFLSSQQWTPAHKVEIIFQRGLIDEETYNRISRARLARNKFIHSGMSPDIAAARDCLCSLIDLLALACSIENIDFERDNLDRYLDTAESSSPKFVTKKSEDVDWSQEFLFKVIPPIPGEKHWTGAFESYPDITIKPILKSEKSDSQ